MKFESFAVRARATGGRYEVTELNFPEGEHDAWWWADDLRSKHIGYFPSRAEAVRACREHNAQERNGVMNA